MLKSTIDGLSAWETVRRFPKVRLAPKPRCNGLCQPAMTRLFLSAT